MENTTNKTNNVVKVAKVAKRDRVIEIKRQIRDVGLWNMPSRRELAKVFGVSHVQVHNDIKGVVAQFDPNELNKCFTEFYNADQKAMTELRPMMNSDNPDIKMKAIETMVKVQKATTELLEAYAKKQKTPDRVQHDVRQVSINIVDPTTNATTEWIEGTQNENSN